MHYRHKASPRYIIYRLALWPVDPSRGLRVDPGGGGRGGGEGGGGGGRAHGRRVTRRRVWMRCPSRSSGRLQSSSIEDISGDKSLLFLADVPRV